MDEAKHLFDRFFHADLDGMSHDGMADIQVGHSRDGSDFRDIGVVKTVSGINHEPLFDGESGSILEVFQLACRSFRCFCVGVGAGVEFDAVGANVSGKLDAPAVTIDEEAHFCAVCLQLACNILDAVAGSFKIEAAFCGQLFAALRDECDLGRREFESKVYDFRRYRHFHIERSPAILGEPADILIVNVAAVFPQMGRNSVDAGGFSDGSHFCWARIGSASCLSHGGDVVYIDVEVCHGDVLQFDRAVLCSDPMIANERM